MNNIIRKIFSYFIISLTSDRLQNCNLFISWAKLR